MATRPGWRDVRERVTGRKILLAIVVTVVALTVLSQFLSVATDNPGSSGGSGKNSSFNTQEFGSRAFADLLERYGHSVSRQAGTIKADTFHPDQVVVLLEGTQILAAEGTALAQFVSRGGHLIVGGNVDLHQLRDAPPVWAPGSGDSWSVTNPDQFGGAQRLQSAGEGEWQTSGSSKQRIEDGGRTLLTSEAVGAGSIDFLADPTLLNNALIGSADNAAFGIALVGDPSRPVVFAEGVHGLQTSEGWRAIPRKWQHAVVLLFIAASIFAWSRGRRFGPAEMARRELAPARAEYVEAIAQQLISVNDVERARAQLASRATHNVHERALETIDVETLAQIYQCSADDLRALFTPNSAPEDQLAATRAFAAIQRSTRT